MTSILIFIGGAVFGAFLYAIMGEKKSAGKTEKKGSVATFAETPKEELKEIQKEAHVALGERTEQRKQKILDAMKEAKSDFAAGCNLRDGKNEKGITCGEVEKLLNITDATARKYLNELEKEKKIKQVGNVGRNVYYILAK